MRATWQACPLKPRGCSVDAGMVATLAEWGRSPFIIREYLPIYYIINKLFVCFL